MFSDLFSFNLAFKMAITFSSLLICIFAIYITKGNVIVFQESNEDIKTSAPKYPFETLDSRNEIAGSAPRNETGKWIELYQEGEAYHFQFEDFKCVFGHLGKLACKNAHCAVFSHGKNIWTCVQKDTSVRFDCQFLVQNKRALCGDSVVFRNIIDAPTRRPSSCPPDQLLAHDHKCRPKEY